MNENNKKGSFFAFEGIDGSGKSTQIRNFAKYLKDSGRRCYETREPTDSPIGSLIHQIMTGRVLADNRAIASLFAADRVDHLLNKTDGICRLIDEGVTVITDRYYFSSYAYHSIDMDMDWVINANSISAEILRPTVTIFLDVPVETALERISRDRFHTELFEKEDRLRKVRELYFKAFDKLQDEESIVIVDAGGDEQEVFSRILSAVSRWVL